MQMKDEFVTHHEFYLLNINQGGFQFMASSKLAGLPGAMRCRRKFLHFFPGGFRDATYLDWEREYKWETHERWEEALGRDEFRRLLRQGEFSEVASRAVRVEQRSRYSMIFSFEKMA